MKLVMVGSLFTIKPDTNLELQILKQVFSKEDSIVIKLSKIVELLNSFPTQVEAE